MNKMQLGNRQKQSSKHLSTKRLILHVGAAKCASTSIQASLQQLAQDCREVFSYHMLNPELLWTVQTEQSRQLDAVRYLDSLLKADGADVIILSHEYLSRVLPTLPTLRHLAQTSVESLGFSDVTIICYTRQQSSYAASAFFQWHFRCRKCLESDMRFLDGLGLDSRFFTAYERFLLTVTLKDTSPNWLLKLRRLRDEILPESDRLKVSSTHIPTRSRSYSLLQDFIARAQLDGQIDSEQLTRAENRANERFHSDIVHPIASLLSKSKDGSSFYPSEHQGNSFYNELSEAADKRNENELTLPYGYKFTELLLNAIDSSRRADNLVYCQEFNVDPEWYSSKAIDSLQVLAEPLATRETILEIAKEETLKRSLSDMRSYENESDRRLNQAMTDLILEKWA